MADPAGLKRPLILEHDRDYADLWFIEDADGNQVEITEHRAEVIVAALEADAEREGAGDTLIAAAARHWYAEAVAREGEDASEAATRGDRAWGELVIVLKRESLRTQP